MAPARAAAPLLRAALSVSLAVAFGSCAGWGAGTTERTETDRAPAAAASSSANGRIVYAGLDGNVYTVDPATGESLGVTADAQTGIREYRSAAWHPDGRTLAFVEVLSANGTPTGSRVLIAEALPGQGPARSVREVAGDPPEYLSWSPDGDQIGLIENPSGEGGTWDFVAVPVGQGEGQRVGQGTQRGEGRGAGTAKAERVSSGRPLYWDWSKDGKRIVSHIGTSDARGNITSTTMEAHLWQGGTLGEALLDTRASSFQTPAVTRSGASFVMAGYSSAESQSKRDAHLLLVSASGEVISELMDVEGLTAFDLSPSEELLAFIDGTVSRYGGVVGPLGIVRMQQGLQGEHYLTALTTEEDVIAFFWSPDGSSLVYFRPQPSGRGPRRLLTLEADLMDARTGETRSVAVFEPSPLFMSRLIPSFDQYQRSATIWAPDGSAFTVNVMVSGRPAVAVVPVSPDGKPSVIAYGNMPFWSPR